MCQSLYLTYQNLRREHDTNNENTKITSEQGSEKEEKTKPTVSRMKET